MEEGLPRVRTYTQGDEWLAEVLQRSRLLRQKGEKFYRKAEYFQSLQCFHKAVKVFKLGQLTQQIRTQSPDLFNQVKSCYLMSANCYLKMQ